MSLRLLLCTMFVLICSAIPALGKGPKSSKPGPGAPTAGAVASGAAASAASAPKEASEEKAGGSLTAKDGVKSVFLKATDYSPTR